MDRHHHRDRHDHRDRHHHQNPVPGVSTPALMEHANQTKFVVSVIANGEMLQLVHLVAIAMKRGKPSQIQNNRIAVVVLAVLMHGVQKLELHPC